MITIWNNKGGTGKSSIAYSLVNDLDAYYMTNDSYNSIISTIYDKTITEIPNEAFYKSEKIIFDGGGFIEEKLTKFIKASSLVIIPLEVDMNSLTSLSNFYFKLKEINENIVLVLNKVESSKTGIKEFNEVLEYLKNEYDISKENLFTLPNSRIFKKIFDEEKGINQILNESKYNSYVYRNVKEDYSLLVERVSKYI